MSALRAAGLLIVTLSLAACAVGPNYHAPALPSGSDSPFVSLNSTLEAPTAPPGAWWRLYSDPRLTALVQQALQANRDLAAADANFAAARAAVSEVHAARYPATDLTSQAVYGRDPVTDEILELGGRHPENIWLYEDVFQAAYEVDLFGRVHRAMEAVSANAQAAGAARDDVRVVVAADTARAYASTCALGEQLDVARRSLRIVQKEADISQQQLQAGAGSRFEVARAQALVAQVGAAIPPLEGERRAEIFELTALLGRTPARAPRGLERCVVPPHLTSLIPVGDGQALIRRRPDVREAERRLAAATADIGVATAQLYPSIHLLGFYGGAATEVDRLNTNLGRIWGVGPSISWSFPNQAGPRAKVRAAKAYQAAALAQFDSVVLRALKETEQALTAYGAALQYRQALGDAQRKIQRTFAIARDGYAAGSSSYLDLLTTEQSLVAINAQVASSDAELIELQVDLFKALGGGWDTRGSD
ncbi:MAG TPA: efflux transporter outer membrane subunit [Steroidobacteraceae bacterium]|nr:efflux transporter outer membrane subunit [Steroidobacteraceae bacterium]